MNENIKQKVGNVEITGIVVVLSDGQDYVEVHTNLPSPMPGLTDQPLRLNFNVQYGKGVEYVKEHFGIEPRVIDARHF